MFLHTEASKGFSEVITFCVRGDMGLIGDKVCTCWDLMLADCLELSGSTMALGALIPLMRFSFTVSSCSLDLNSSLDVSFKVDSLLGAVDELGGTGAGPLTCGWAVLVPGV